MCLQEYSLAHCPPSLLAATAILLALRLLQPEVESYVESDLANYLISLSTTICHYYVQVCLSSAWTSTLAYYSTYGLRQLLPLLHKMALVVQKAHDPKAALKVLPYSPCTRPSP